jgi:hypothetical protein
LAVVKHTTVQVTHYRCSERYQKKVHNLLYRARTDRCIVVYIFSTM